jgi:hypothetical protein
MRRALLFLPLCLLLGASAPDGGAPDAGATDAGAADAGAPHGCPGSSKELVEGSRCNPDRVARCEYAAASCACEADQCVTAAGPSPGCVAQYRWHCRHDGCPKRHPPSGRCRHEGKVCSYDDGLCASSTTCQDGKWSQGFTNCRPAAPPRGGRDE